MGRLDPRKSSVQIEGIPILKLNLLRDQLDNTYPPMKTLTVYNPLNPVQML